MTRWVALRISTSTTAARVYINSYIVGYYLSITPEMNK